jgi:hypothetical protein
MNTDAHVDFHIWTAIYINGQQPDWTTTDRCCNTKLSKYLREPHDIVIINNRG